MAVKQKTVTEETAIVAEQVEIEEETEAVTVDKKTKSGKSKPVRKSLLSGRVRTLEDVYIETSNIGMDMALTNGKGIPLGGFVTFWGQPGSGKTTILGDTIKRVLLKYEKLNIPCKVLYIDIEGSTNLMGSLGLQRFLDNGSLIYLHETITYNYLGDLYQGILDGDEELKDVKLVIVDSICNVTVESKEENDIEKADYGIIAKAAKEFYRRYTPKTRGKFTSLLINQVSMNQDAGLFGPKFKQASSEASLHYPTIIVHAQKVVGKKEDDISKLMKIKTINGEEEVQEKFIVRLTTFNEGLKLKNRFGQIPSVDILVQRGVGVVNAKVVKDLLFLHNLVTPATSKTYAISESLPLVEHPKKNLSKTEVNTIVSNKDNLPKIVKYLKDNNLYWVKDPSTINKPQIDADGYHVYY